MDPIARLVRTDDLVVESNDALVSIVELVRTERAVTRSELGRISGLGRSIVTQRVQDAIDLGLIEDAELGVSTGGRVPRNLRFRSEIGSFFHVAFGARNLGVAITDLAGKVLSSWHEEWDISVGPEKSLRRATQILEQMAIEVKPAEIWAVTVGVPGPVEFKTGKPVAPPIMPGWNGFDIRGWLTKVYGAPCWVDNDVNLMALGEQVMLRESADDEDAEDLLYIKIGSGIGAGIIASGRAHRGAKGSAGDIGHIAAADDSKVVCRCGQNGCLEAIAGGWALARDGEVAAKSGKSEFLVERLTAKGFLAPRDVADGANSGDAFCVESVVSAGRTVGETLATLVNLFNPAVVFVGGTIAETGDLFLAAVRQTVYRRSLPLATRDLKILSSNPSHTEGLLGGVALAQTEVFSRATMSKWIEDKTPRALLA